ncbi:MAG: hypothetical protein R3E77_14925 [Steroidobacteraceae bacterium]
MDRRRFVGSAALVALGPLANSLLSGCSTKDAASVEPTYKSLSARQAKTLFGVSRALFPHADAPDTPYLDVIATLDGMASGNDDTRKLLVAAVDDLDARSAAGWLDESAATKVAILENLQDKPWFDPLLQTSLNTIYRHPDIWAMIGYEGSSLEFGGYLKRGFDDIDWLPNAAVEAV